MGDLHVVGIKKLNVNNCNTCATWMVFYLQGQGFWKVVGGSEITLIDKDANDIVCKWIIKTSKVMFVLKTTIEDEMLEHIWGDKTSK